MKHQRVSLRFAKAAFDLAIENNQVEAVKNDMQLIYDTICNSKELRLMLRSPIIKNNTKYSAFKKIFENQIGEISFKFLALILKKNRENCIEEICSKFLKLYTDSKGVKTAIITTAVPLNDIEKKQILSFLSQKLNSEIILKEEIDSKIIGGFFLKIDDLIYDTTILGKLDLFRKYMQHKQVV